MDKTFTRRGTETMDKSSRRRNGFSQSKSDLYSLLCDLPAGKKAIDCKWVFKLKQSADGNVYRHKARRRKFAPLK